MTTRTIQWLGAAAALIVLAAIALFFWPQGPYLLPIILIGALWAALTVVLFRILLRAHRAPSLMTGLTALSSPSSSSAASPSRGP